MRTYIIILITVIMIIPCLNAADRECWSHSYSNEVYLDDSNVFTNIDDDVITICFDNCDYNRIKITSDYELYINGKHIKTDDDQKELIEEFYNQTMELTEYAGQIGERGAKIGLSGAALGLKAVGSVFRAVFSDYDFDDIERELEIEAEEFEEQAELLEEQAEAIEEIADELEYIYNELKQEVPELHDLDWF
ncbi:MAG: hypothetical protein J7K40_10830 [candidate division Zixibacteria bacterium]|nr:hypothetical protein [candidate division Zixibacteria bacterium]